MWKILTSLLLVVIVQCNASSSYDLGGVLGGNRMAGAPLGLSLGAGDLDVEGVCVGPGAHCQNCTHAVTCIQLPVGWLKVPLQICSKGQTCNAHLGGCTAEAAPECHPASQAFQHSCEQVGTFPDAFDCRRFHMCVPPAHYADQRPADHRAVYCPRHYGYNPLTAQCSLKLRHGQCLSKPVPDCLAVGQFGVLPGSPNHYYVCLSKIQGLYPQVFVCPHGHYFWNGFCNADPQPANFLEQTPLVIPSSSEEATTETVNPTEPEQSSTEYPQDTFLADKFNLKDYAMNENDNQDNTAASYEFSSSSIESF